jgi:hypothetical protein
MTIRDINSAMHDYLPRFYEDIREANAILDSESKAISQLTNDINDVLAQFFVDTATWGLANWERFCGFPVIANNSVWDTISKRNVSFDSIEGDSWDLLEHSFLPNIDDRRSAIKSKLRGTGTVTKELIANVCAAYTGGTVEVHEFPSEYRIQIVFTDIAGVPTNINTLQSVISEIMPAHLIVEYTYRYLHWSELDGYAWSWDSLDAKDYTWDELSTAIQ